MTFRLVAICFEPFQLHQLNPLGLVQLVSAVRGKTRQRPLWAPSRHAAVHNPATDRRKLTVTPGPKEPFVESGFAAAQLPISRHCQMGPSDKGRPRFIGLFTALSRLCRSATLQRFRFLASTDLQYLANHRASQPLMQLRDQSVWPARPIVFP